MNNQSKACPVCDQVHDLNPLRRKSKTVVKGQEIEVEEAFLVCPNASEEEREFVNGRLLNDNLLSALDAYRTANGLLTSGEIKEIRQKLGISQSNLSLLLGWGEVTVTRYETKSIQDETYDQWMRWVSRDPLFALGSLERHRSSFTEDVYSGIRDRLIRNMEAEGNTIYVQQEIERTYYRFHEPSEFNGNRRIDIGKIESSIGYIAHQVDPLYKTALMKMLWYADMLHFRRHGTSITGLVYEHQKYGALPIGFEEIMRLPSVRVEEVPFDSYYGYKVTSVLDRSRLDLAEGESSVLHDVVNRLGPLATREIVECMHKEEAYTSTQNRDLLSYTHAQRLNWPAT